VSPALNSGLQEPIRVLSIRKMTGFEQVAEPRENSTQKYSEGKRRGRRRARRFHHGFSAVTKILLSRRAAVVYH
jgi:hypothetical protein